MKKYSKKFLAEKKFYSPGPVPAQMNIEITSGHRSIDFETLYKKLKTKLKKKFKLESEWDVLFIQGSGTAAIETVLSSLDSQLLPIIYPSGTFSDRAKAIAERYSIASDAQNIGTYHYSVLFETSNSTYNRLEWTPNHSDLTIIDAVSALGYYEFPKYADIVIGSSSKILGGIPVMGLIFYKPKTCMKWFRNKGDYLNIMKYITYAKRSQTPHTPLIPQMLSLYTSLDKMISKKVIERNCMILYNIGNKQSFIRNAWLSPVQTVKCENVDIVLKMFKQYNIEPYYNPSYMKDYFQISMFNYSKSEYYEIIQDVLDVFG